MRISLVTGAVNAVTAGILIYIFDLNIYGAGIAAIVSRLCGAVAAFALLFRKGYISSLSSLFKPKILYIKQIMRIGLYGSAENLIFQFGRTITYRNFSGAVHIAANSVTGSIFNIIAAPANSMSIVAMSLIGRLTGAGEKEQSYKVLRNIIFMSMGLLVLTDIVFLPFTPGLISFYTSRFEPDNLAEIRRLVNQLVGMNMLFMPAIWPAAFIIFSGMKGAGDVRYTTTVSIITMWSVRVLFAYILGDLLGWGVVGVWSGMFADWAARSVFAIVRFRSRKWQEKSAIE
jgi:Na+-driven multidrug efflux pump